MQSTIEMTNDQALDALVPDDRLAERTALVTGASSGIGEAIARVLASSGARVAVAGRDRERLAAVVSTIERVGGLAVAVSGDLSGDPAGVRGVAEQAHRSLGGRIDILVNNAGVYPVTLTDQLPDADLDAMLRTNVRAPHVLVAAIAPEMASRGSGVIVNVGSWMARVGTSYGAMYTATKAAIEQLTRNWSAEYGPRGIRVNTVAPGATATPGNADAADVLAQMTKATVAGRPVRPIDIAYAVRWLSGDEAAFVHGAILDVDGGISATRLG